MHLEAVRAFCLAKPGATEDLPFGDDVLVFRVMGKIFALTNLDGPPYSVNLKCDPAWAVELRDRYDGVRPGYHMNKKHWNTVLLDGSVPGEDIAAMIDHSYEQVASGLKKADREALAGL